MQMTSIQWRSSSVRVLATAVLVAAAWSALGASDSEKANLMLNGSFEEGLAGWETQGENATIKAHHTSDRWNTYSLSFRTKGHTQVHFYISVSPDKHTGGTVWFDNIRCEGVEIENPSFERVLVDGTAPGWEYMYKMYTEMKRHAKLVIGADFQHASEGTLSMRFSAPPQRNMWKLARVAEPKELAEGWKPPHPMEGWRPIVEGEMVLWQVLTVKPDTEYTIHMDYRMSRDFNGVIRPAVGGSMQPWHLLAHAGWQWTEFKELQQLRKRFGTAAAGMTITDGNAELSQQVAVEKGATVHLHADVGTARTHTGEPLEMTARIAVEDAATGKTLAEDHFFWDGAPGHGEGMVEKGQAVEGESTDLVASFVCPSNRIRVRLVGTGKGDTGTVMFGNVTLTRLPYLTPPVQTLTVKDTQASFRIGDTLSYRVREGDANDIEGALWLLARDLEALGIDFAASAGDADISIAIGAYNEHGDQGYHLAADARGVRVEAASARAAQYALMTLVQLVGGAEGERFIRGAQIADWPDMPVRGVVMESCSHFMPPGDDPVRLVDHLYHDSARQTWSREDLLQLARWKFNTIWWRSTTMSDPLLELARRLQFDSMTFISTISDPPTHDIFVEHPEWIEGVYIEDEKVRLAGLEVTNLANGNVIRDDQTDIVVTSGDKKTTYVEDKDYRVTGKMGSYDPSKKKMTEHKPFGIARLEGSRIADGDTVLVSYDTIDKGKAYSWHTQYCPSVPEAAAWVGERVKEAAGKWKTKYVHIRGDELTHVNSDSRCRRRGLRPDEILLEHVDFVKQKALEGHPETQVVMWHDAFSPYSGGYRWGFTEAGPTPPADIWQMVWYYGPGQPTGIGWATVQHNQRQGLTSIVLPWFDLENIREWAQVVSEARRRGWRCLGIMDTPWGRPNAYPNFRETAIVSWKVPVKGEKGWLEFFPPDAQ